MILDSNPQERNLEFKMEDDLLYLLLPQGEGVPHCYIVVVNQADSPPSTGGARGGSCFSFHSKF